MFLELPVDPYYIEEMKPLDYGYIDVYYIPWKMWLRFYYDRLADSQYRHPNGRRFRYPSYRSR